MPCHAINARMSMKNFSIVIIIKSKDTIVGKTYVAGREFSPCHSL